ncbi:hypothetical protein XBKQ1_1080002 [Xenorhabdus bovienii str. kraussei Quebec]|uniref:Uncharacterized protein n=1 Tax=Xenorhabdus bovienii str. kraussei Quebec TaxID=1398203 RepID=A0A077PBD0_XENBV|nr:hypothetical protein XBKQ1_1080002 [Xenorhabdus bovienii str. kraussei Quebec]
MLMRQNRYSHVFGIDIIKNTNNIAYDNKIMLNRYYHNKVIV